MANVYGLPFWLSILPVFETLRISLFNQLFQCASLPILGGFSAVITLLASNYAPAIIFRAVFALNVILKCRKWHLTGRRAWPQAH